MIVCFLDSSALTKLFLAERGSVELSNYLANFEPLSLTVSTIGMLEVTSALQRTTNAGIITLSERDEQLTNLMELLGSIAQVVADESTLAIASEFIFHHPHLRSLDAIQLASARLTRDGLEISDRVLLIASDHRLLKAAKTEGFEVWDPAELDSRPIPVVPVN